ncbi:MAG: hypothetical protein KI792_08125 [Alphaproteobacteria bacterium]|nr:hypothetical protein [Alphaproteobacteria bacterium SS10]
MLSPYLQRSADNQLPAVDAVTLETIGLVKGTAKLGGGDIDAVAPAAKALSETLGKVVHANRHSMDSELSRFLSDASEQLGQIGELTTAAGRDRAFEAAQERLDLQATRIFSHRYAIELRREHDRDDRAALGKVAETDPAMKIALKMGQI